jgi:hypothetical protein
MRPLSDIWLNHPEAKPGEILLTNDSDTGAHIIWKTKRNGKIAYNCYGDIINEYVPIFVQIKELETAGINPDSVGLPSLLKQIKERREVGLVD